MAQRARRQLSDQPRGAAGRGRSASLRARAQLSAEQRLSTCRWSIAGDRVVDRVQSESPDLIVLDLGLPGRKRVRGVQGVARRQPRSPILILTARNSDIDQVLGLELGADDFVIKPVEPRVLVARIHALLRRSKGPGAVENRKLSFGALSIDTAARSVALERQGRRAVEQRVRSAAVPRHARRARSSPARRSTSICIGANTTASIERSTCASRTCAGSSATPASRNGSRPSGVTGICSCRTRGSAWRAISCSCIC